ncbi:CoA-binding protein [Nocardioides sp. TF02-7]|uniref:CoA-binding protein n=1 Tax=Nocardioides sp. TF02-7 TaxID=2917724 RepID=UPI001F054BB3|nr:CoA-binding protein [Nocardioides sp. TF02-7]UMG92786.1 CoA-binding protein [Nocardioides sp. TF02-7]
MPAYKTVNEIPDDVDVAIVAVPAEAVTDVVLDCAAKGVHGLIVISSGFAETGEDGRKRQRHLVGLSRSYGLRLIGPNCLGVINTDPRVRINASLSSVMPARGRAGFFCQSGALGSAILEKVKTGAWASRPSSAPATAPTSRATTCSSTGRRTTPPRS